MLLENTEWKHLPDAGGILDQPEGLMLDLSTISYVSQLVEQMMKGEKDGG